MPEFDRLSLLVSTPNNLLMVDLGNATCISLDSGHGEYYGITWNDAGSDLALTYSGLDNATLISLEDYAQSEVGGLRINGKASWEFLSQPHQAYWHENYIYVAHSGRNALTRFDPLDAGIRHFRFDEVLWDRLDKNDPRGSHFNSLDIHDGSLYLLAHNFGRGSFVLVLGLPELELLDRVEIPYTSGAHNIWIMDEDTWLICDSANGMVRNARGGQALWWNGGRGHVRGMAATERYLLIGHSAASDDRHTRKTSESGIWVIDRADWAFVDYFRLGDFGAVHEIRVLDQTDHCHAHAALPSAAVLELFAVGEENAPAKAIQRCRESLGVTMSSASRLCRNPNWILALATGMPGDSQEDGEFFLPDGGFLILVRNGELPPADVYLSANLMLFDSRGAGHGSLVARYRGPRDRNMCVALFRYDGRKLFAGLWENDGEWKQLGDVQVASHVLRKAKAAAGDGNVPDGLTEIWLRITGDRAAVGVAGNEVISMNLSGAVSLGGRVGIRIQGRSLGIRDFEFRGT